MIELAEQAGQIEPAIYNAGNNYSGNFLEMEVSLFEQAWLVGTLGGFLFAQEVLHRMAPRNRGTLIFTGAGPLCEASQGSCPSLQPRQGYAQCPKA